MILFPKRYSRTQNSSHISKMPWVQLMGVISILLPQHHFKMYTKTKKALFPKTAFLHVYFLFSFATLLLDGNAQQQMLDYGMMQSMMILWYPRVNITLQMQVLLLVISSCFHIEVCATILQSGVVPICGM